MISVYFPLEFLHSIPFEGLVCRLRRNFVESNYSLGVIVSASDHIHDSSDGVIVIIGGTHYNS